MQNEKRNNMINQLEQDYVLALYDSYQYFVRDWDVNISFSEYLQAITLGLTQPALAEALADDRTKRWQQGE